MNGTVIAIKGNIKITNDIGKLFKIKENSIISLDYYSHKQLKTTGIEHEIYDNFLTENDKEIIDNATFHITTNWHKNKTAQDYLLLNGINLGWLLDMEFYFHLITIMTIFYSLLKIKEIKNPKTIIISNDLFDLVKSIFPGCEIRLLEEVKEKTQSFVFDSFEVKYNIGQIPMTLIVPRKYFFALRYYYEKLFIPLFNKIFTKPSKQKNSIILVDFDASKYDEFLKHLSQKNKNIFLLNRRRAAIWNFKSFSVIKKTKCIPITYEKFLNRHDKDEMKKLIADIRKNFDLLLDDQKYFIDFFSVRNYSLWPYLNKYFKDYCMTRFEEAIYEMIGSRKLLSSLKPSLILNFYDAALQEKVLIYQARKQNIPSVLVQHGTPYLEIEQIPKLKPILGTLSIYEEKKIAVWGNPVKEFALKNGTKEENIIVSGSIRHDPFFHMKKKNNNKKGIILVLLGQLNIINVESQSTATYDRYEEALKIICNTLKKFSDRKKIAKLHPGPMHYNTVVVEPIIRQTNPSIKIMMNANLPELIKSADVVISIGLTTVLMEANILEKPAITLVADNQDFLNVKSLGHSELFTVSESMRFEKFLDDILTNDKLRDEHIKKGIEFVNTYLANHGKASEYLANKITEN